ncbi:PEP-utilizing enzyme [Williamsia herbipolensis]|uniref:PEP-utilizing enzyme n=1 Tax=Williamsia herbipolensis TaxID=1603258 RepID=A0AAU4K3W4_9NOCA|nr:PEP/pyruvate-binding domain-containing protein [Williamsia herbipolensis]
MTTTVEFDDVVDERFGGKAAGLARLRRLGFPVPAGFVVADPADGISDEVAERWFARMRDLGATPLAVRSSALGEDGGELSFAGQYDTVLGVGTADDLVRAVQTCTASTGSHRVTAYAGRDVAAMHLVVQQMVDARAAGVVFSADPATGRRDLMVIDAVAGLGDTLVDGTASPDHFVLDAHGDCVIREVGADPAISVDELRAIHEGAIRAVDHWGRPMDLEWAIDRDGQLWWLQARPITTLPGALDAMDSPLAGDDHVYTRCNIGEMMPGAYCPLTAAVSGFAIDYAMQMTQVVARAQPRYESPWRQVGYFQGHMFLNLTEGTALSAGILGNSLEQFSMSVCGRVVEELVPKPPQPFVRRLVNTVLLTGFALSAGPAIRRLGDQIAGFDVPDADDPREVLRQLDDGVDLFCEVMVTHVRSSSRAAVAANVLESVMIRRAVAGGGHEDEGRAAASRLMAGATDVESAVMLAELDEVARAIAADPSAGDFTVSEPGAAVTRLRTSTGVAGVALRGFLHRHGHRGYRELCMRDPSWGEDPQGLGTMLQVMVRAASDPVARRAAPRSDQTDDPPPVRLLARLARGGARGREETKSKLAAMAHSLKLGYRHLGQVLARTGRLPDADLVYFFDRDELRRVVGPDDITDLVQAGLRRRSALPYQEALEFDDVSVGRPTPLVVRPPNGVDDSEIVGRPAGRGCVDGVVRVAKSIAEARDVRVGEILVAPVTDVGWTPYFTVIAALVTDIGSSVSHGAVVAREYGLPCVVNTLVATRTLRTGDRVRVDGDRGVVTRLSDGTAA